MPRARFRGPGRAGIRACGAISLLLGSAPGRAADAPAMEPLLARPLFSPTRRPHQAGLAPSAAAPGEAAPRLMGIVIAGAVRLAVFAPGQRGRPLILREGEQVGGYRIGLIAARHVDLEGPAGPRVVVPRSDPALRDGLAAALPPAPLIDPYRRETETENDQ